MSSGTAVAGAASRSRLRAEEGLGLAGGGDASRRCRSRGCGRGAGAAPRPAAVRAPVLFPPWKRHGRCAWRAAGRSSPPPARVFAPQRGASM